MASRTHGKVPHSIEASTGEGIPRAAGPAVDALRRAGQLVLERLLGGGAPAGERVGDGSSGVELCRRPADIPVLEQLGVQHWWLRAAGLEAGMGKRGGGVPGQPGGSRATLRTTINDHTGQGAMPGSECTPVEQNDPRWAHLDRDCLREELRTGTATGAWVPPFNDCHEVVKDVLDRCRVPGLPGGDVLPLGVEPQDAGVPPEATQ